MTPTQRTLATLRADGFMASVVERWNPHARVRQDLFGFADVIAVRNGETLAVQTTSSSNAAARVYKLRHMESVRRCLEAGWRVEVWGWKKYAKPVDRRYWRHTAVSL